MKQLIATHLKPLLDWDTAKVAGVAVINFASSVAAIDFVLKIIFSLLSIWYIWLKIQKLKKNKKDNEDL